MEIKKPSVFIGTPSYDGKMQSQYVLSLVQTVEKLRTIGYDAVIEVISGGALLIESRNIILSNFLKSDSEFLLMIDSDIGWNSDSVVNMIKRDLPFIAGVYTSKTDENEFLFQPLIVENTNQLDICKDTGLLKAEFAPAGFVLVKKSLVKHLYSAYNNLMYSYSDSEGDQAKYGQICGLFNTEVVNGRFIGEDNYFCKKVSDLGYDILVDPYISFNHSGINSCLATKLVAPK